MEIIEYMAERMMRNKKRLMRLFKKGVFLGGSIKNDEIHKIEASKNCSPKGIEKVTY